MHKPREAYPRRICGGRNGVTQVHFEVWKVGPDEYRRVEPGDPMWNADRYKE